MGHRLWTFPFLTIFLHYMCFIYKSPTHHENVDFSSLFTGDRKKSKVVFFNKMV